MVFIKSYFAIEDGENINSIQELYLTHSTILIKLIDTEGYDDMMVRVILDILNKEKVYKDISKLSKKYRMYLGPIIYIWAIENWKYFSQLPQRTYKMSSIGLRIIDKDPFGDFIALFKKSFKEDIYEESKYQRGAKELFNKIKKKNNSYHITLKELNNPHHFFDFINRAVVKFDNSKNQLKLCYIENTHPKSTLLGVKMSKYNLEIFKGIRKIQQELKMERGQTPQLIVDERYEDLYEEAILRGYLNQKNEEKIFPF